MQPVAYTDKMRLVDAALQKRHETTLEDWLRSQRDRYVSFGDIAGKLTRLIEDDGLSVSYEAARQWCDRFGLAEEPAS